MDEEERSRRFLQSQYEDEILQLTEDVDKLPRTDLQGITMAIVMRIIRDTKRGKL